ncbi:ABC transporter ATP-binding protein [Mesorhizobium sp. M0187]|uniref:ABC transporter ATP-binding protein n=1 Tax=Mesorhizobium sp. M0187 TaxID=2956908 RepID=UPI0033352C05
MNPGSASATPRERSLLNVSGLSVSFETDSGLVRAVRDVSFQLSRKEILAIVGESGSGKTATVLSLLGLIDRSNGAVTGTVEFQDQDILKLSDRKLRRLRGPGIALIPQDPMTAMTPVYTVGWQIAEQIRAHEKIPLSSARRRAVELLGEVGFAKPSEIAGRYPHELSGGMRQRAIIAMSISSNPVLLIADELTSALDRTAQVQVLSLLDRLRTHLGSSIILVSHSMSVAADIADKVAVMYAGRIVEHAPTGPIFSRPNHPYTWGMLASIPPLSGKRQSRLSSIPGAPPSSDEIGNGCSFAPRCRFRMGICDTAPQYTVENDHFSLCHLEPVDRPAHRDRVLGAEAPAPRTDAARSALKPIIAVKALTKIYRIPRALPGSRGGIVVAVDGVTFEVAEGEAVGLVGESGCGKTTLGRCIARLYEISGGAVEFEGVDISHAPERRLALFRRRVQMTFQDPSSSLNPRRRIGDIIAEPILFHKLRRPADLGARLKELMQLVGLPVEALERYPHEFSGGQRQRIGIARALAVEPALIIADEPVSALDVSLQAQMVNLFLDLRDQLNLSLIFIAHDLAVIRQIADRMAIMYLGSLVEIGNTEDLFERPAHPYAKALVSSVQQTRAKPRPRTILMTDMPSSHHTPKGCKFSPHCSIVQDRCRAERPLLRAITGNRQVACHYPKI